MGGRALAAAAFSLAVLAATGAQSQIAGLDDETAARLAEAQEAYNGGNAEEALRLWNAAADDGMRSPWLDYARGNACYRLGRLPEAISFYRRAQRELPRDPDIAGNLQIAARDAGVALPVAAWPLRWLEGLSQREWMGVVYAAFWLAVALAAAAIWLPSPWPRRFAWPLVVCLALLAVAWAGVLWPLWEERAHPERVAGGDHAVIMRSAPIESASALAELPPGTLLRTLSARPLWVEVESGELRGWVPESALLEK